MLNFYREGLSFEVGKPSRGIGALTPDAAQQLGPKAVELQKKEAAAVKLPQVKLANSYNRNIKKEKKLNEFSLPRTGTVLAPSTDSKTGQTSMQTKQKFLGMPVPFQDKLKDLTPTAADTAKYNANPNRPTTINRTVSPLSGSISATSTSNKPTTTTKPVTPIPSSSSVSDRAVQGLQNTAASGKAGGLLQRIDNIRTAKNAAMQKNSYEMDYQNVLETLINHNFANDYDSAVDMITGLSEKFIEAISEEYLEEKARGTRPKTTSHAYDMDETLFGHDHSKVNVHVHNEKGERTQSLSNQEFNTHKLPKGHNYNFDEFRSSKVFGKSAKPLKKMIKHLNRQKARGYDTHIVTARSDMDDQPAFAKHLSKYGININPNEEGSGHTHVHRTGNLPGSDVGTKKRDTLQGLAQKHGYKKIHMYDDAAKVHKAVQNTPGVEVKTHMVKPRGKSGEVRARSFRATETQKEQYYIDFGTNVEELREVDTTPYEYWKEFIR